MIIYRKKPLITWIMLLSALIVGCSNETSSSSTSLEFQPNTSETEIPEIAFSDDDYLYKAKDGDELSITVLEQATTVGDSTLYKYGDYEILVDGGMPATGPNLSSVLKEKVTDGVLDLLILTHQHYDHFGGLSSSVLKEAGIKKVTTFVDNGVLTFNKDYLNVWINDTKPYLIKNGSIYHPIQDYFSSISSLIPIAKDLTLAFLDSGYYPVKNSEGVYVSNGSPNEESIGFVLYAKEYEIISLGDAIKTTEASYIKKYSSHPFRKEKDTVIFKANHHAASNANTQEFMSFIKPDYSFISAAISSGNSSEDGIISVQEPLPSVRKRIEKYTGNDNVYWTGTTGNLTISFDSSFSSFSFAGEGRKIGTYYYLNKIIDPAGEKNLPIEKTEWAEAEKEAIGY